jgi:hypothetical protein
MPRGTRIENIGQFGKLPPFFYDQTCSFHLSTVVIRVCLDGIGRVGADADTYARG